MKKGYEIFEAKCYTIVECIDVIENKIKSLEKSSLDCQEEGMDVKENIIKRDFGKEIIKDLKRLQGIYEDAKKMISSII